MYLASLMTLAMIDDNGRIGWVHPDYACGISDDRFVCRQLLAGSFYRSLIPLNENIGCNSSDPYSAYEAAQLRKQANKVMRGELASWRWFEFINADDFFCLQTILLPYRNNQFAFLQHHGLSNVA